MPVIKALKTMLSDGQRHYPIYLGYLPADELDAVAEVPSFDNLSSNSEIARNVLNPPIEDWQRPLIDPKWKAIRDKFSQPNELMPNPVLLAVADAKQVTVTQQELHGQTTELFEINVALPSGGGSKALWILDGQHRVRGISQSKMKHNPMPLVLLHGDAANGYSPKQFARVFAEVTTYATPLNPIHEDWLRYAFRLGTYQPPKSGHETVDWKAATAAAKLCEMQSVGSANDTNPFYDKILFNPELDPVPAVGEGFTYTSLSLKDLLLDGYYNRPGAGLDPEPLAVVPTDVVNGGA